VEFKQMMLQLFKTNRVPSSILAEFTLKINVIHNMLAFWNFTHTKYFYI